MDAGSILLSVTAEDHMDHEAAVRLRAAERYRSGELSPEDRDAFEDHFFECPKCAEALRFERAFIANARAALLEKRAKRRASESSGPLGDGLGLKE